MTLELKLVPSLVLLHPASLSTAFRAPIVAICIAGLVLLLGSLRHLALLALLSREFFKNRIMSFTFRVLIPTHLDLSLVHLAASSETVIVQSNRSLTPQNASSVAGGSDIAD